MTVGELIELLGRFPPQFPVYFASEILKNRATAPCDAVMNLVHQSNSNLSIISDDFKSRIVPDGFVDSVVIYPCVNGADA